MIYPKFIKKGDNIGITAVSAGVGYKLDSFNKSINSINKMGFNTYETSNVRVDNEISASPEQRGKELKELFENKDVNFIMCAAGGDFCFEMMPYVDCEVIKNNPKWIIGYSDPTSILYLITTKVDIATMYGMNAGSFDQYNLHESLKNTFEIMQGNIIKQNSFDLYESNQDESKDGYNLTEDVYWENLNGDFNVKGRCIGGCLDVLKDMFGTKYDYTSNYINKYKEDGFIWYFDVFSLKSEDMYRTLLQMKYAGYFKFCKAVLVGRVRFPNSFTSMTYQMAFKKIFKDIPVCFNMDIGHVAPKMTLINGAIMNVKSKDGKGSIEFELK